MKFLNDAPHPERAIGIPPIVISAKPSFKRKYADLSNWSGPLTLTEAVERGYVARDHAERLIAVWEEYTERKWEPPLLELAS